MTAFALAILLGLTQQETKDIVYAKPSGTELKLDLVIPPNAKKPMPVMVLIHGGGWMAGKKEDMAAAVPGMAGLGFACLSVQYRLAPTAQWPAQLEDVKAAVRWAKENAALYGFDKTKIATMGFSAGGHLAAMLATTGYEGKWDLDSRENSSVALAISFAGPTDLVTAWKHKDTQPAADKAVLDSCLPALLGDTYEKKAFIYKDASPIYHVTGKTAPLFLLHGADDTLVLKEQSDIMFRILKSQNVLTEMYVIPKAGHVQLGEDPNVPVVKVVEFIKKVLRI